MRTENEIAKIVVDASLQIHRDLGPGLLESVYEVILTHELTKRGLHVDRQVRVPIEYNGITFEEAFRADMLIDGKVILELKSVEKTNNAHKKQVLTYLRLMGHKLGLLINFGEAYIRDGITRVANGLSD